MDLEIDFSLHGPMLAGHPTAVLNDFVTEATWEVGGQGLANVHRVLDISIKHPTPYYETQIMMERAANDVVVHDRGIIYGPWLEGVSSRNRTTRFKGYAAFRKATQQLRGQVPQLLDATLRRYLRRLR